MLITTPDAEDRLNGSEEIVEEITTENFLNIMKT